MTNETEYGPEIVVDGVRPEWLRDDEELQIRAADGYEESDTAARYTSDPNWWLHSAGKDRIVAIRLPCPHPYYQVAAHNAKHGTQFKYWPGGDEAPGDWDGDEYGVLYRDRKNGGWLSFTQRQARNWKHYGTDWDIIGYTPKPCAASIHDCGASIHGNIHDTDATTAKSSVVEHHLNAAENSHFFNEIGDMSNTPQPDFVPCERTVRHLIAAMPDAAYGSHDWRRGVKDCLTEMEAMLPKKDRAEELANAFFESPCEEGDVYYGMVGNRANLAFARWLIAQGEIRG